MKKLYEIESISAGKTPWSIAAKAIIKTIAHGFDYWKRKRQEKYDRYYQNLPCENQEDTLPLTQP